jgi:hypothetical protein
MPHDDFLDRTPMRALLPIPRAVIDHARALAYESYRTGRHEQADALCRGLLALDHRCGWTHALHAATLRDTGRRSEALRVVADGLRYEPAHPTLLALRDELSVPADGAAGAAVPFVVEALR